MPMTTDRPQTLREALGETQARNTRLCQLIRELHDRFEWISVHTTCESSRELASAALDKVRRDLQ